MKRAEAEPSVSLRTDKNHGEWTASILSEGAAHSQVPTVLLCCCVVFNRYWRWSNMSFYCWLIIWSCQIEYLTNRILTQYYNMRWHLKCIRCFAIKHIIVLTGTVSMQPIIGWDEVEASGYCMPVLNVLSPKSVSVSQIEQISLLLRYLLTSFHFISSIDYFIVTCLLCVYVGSTPLRSFGGIDKSSKNISLHSFSCMPFIL